MVGVIAELGKTPTRCMKPCGLTKGVFRKRIYVWPRARRDPTPLKRVDCTDSFQALFRLKNDQRATVDFAYAIAAGMVSSVSVPESSSLQTASLPPTTLARSRMPGNP